MTPQAVFFMCQENVLCRDVKDTLLSDVLIRIGSLPVTNQESEIEFELLSFNLKIQIWALFHFSFPLNPTGGGLALQESVNVHVGARGSRMRSSLESREGRGGVLLSVSWFIFWGGLWGFQSTYLHVGLLTVAKTMRLSWGWWLNSPQPQHSENDTVNYHFFFCPVRMPVCVWAVNGQETLQKFPTERK